MTAASQGCRIQPCMVEAQQAQLDSRRRGCQQLPERGRLVRPRGAQPQMARRLEAPTQGTIQKLEASARQLQEQGKSIGCYG